MSKVSELIGEVVDGKLKENRTIDGEKFYTIRVSFRGTEIPVLFSKYVNQTEYPENTKLKIIGCLMSDVANGSLPVFYFYANNITVVDMDTESTNLVNFTCTVTKVRYFKANDSCVDILPLVGSYTSPLNRVSVLYLCARGGMARKLKNKPKGYVISGTGYLKAFRDVHEVNIVSIDNLDELATE